jgi:nitrite reductase (NAD(P)H)
LRTAAMAEPEPIPTPGLEPTSMDTHSPPASPPQNPTWGEKNGKDGKKANEGWIEPEAKGIPDKVEEGREDGKRADGEKKRKRVVVVGLGMVGIAFM